jgi:hypothetical protein
MTSFFQRNMMLQFFFLSLFVFSEMVFYPNPLRSQGLPDSGGAIVAEDSLPVYSANSPKSDIVKVLNKGDLVWIQIEITGAEDKWCLLSEKGKHEPLGFVLCKDLQHLDQDPQKIPPDERGIDRSVLRDDSGLQSRDPADQGAIPYSFHLGSLLQAVWKGDISAVKELLAKGVNPNARTVMGASPLHGAAKKDETEMTRTLIAHGADVNARDGNGLTPLMAAASVGQAQNMEALLAAGARINDRDDTGFTALMWAVVQASPQGVEALLENNAEINARTKEGRTALWYSKQLVANARKSLAGAFRKNDENLIKELRTKLAKYEEAYRLLQEFGGKE